MNLDDASNLASFILEWPPSFILVGFVYGLFVYNTSFLKTPDKWLVDLQLLHLSYVWLFPHSAIQLASLPLMPPVNTDSIEVERLRKGCFTGDATYVPHKAAHRALNCSTRWDLVSYTIIWQNTITWSSLNSQSSIKVCFLLYSKQPAANVWHHVKCCSSSTFCFIVQQLLMIPS